MLNASVAVQLTGVLPTGNSEPDAGEHIVVTGAVPPVTLGAKLTATGLPLEDCAVGAGHVIANAGAGVRYEISDDEMLRMPAALYD